MKINPYVFYISAGIILLFVAAGIVFTGTVSSAFGGIQDFIVVKLGWFYILSVAFFLVFTIWLAFSSYGSIKLGKDDDEPDYSRTSWFAMLFSAGMGIGLLFYSVAEPITHFANPPRAAAGNLETALADMEMAASASSQGEARAARASAAVPAKNAINITYFHWGLHAWAIYIVLGLALAYFAYRHDLPLTLRSTLYPLLGERIHGPIGNLVDIVAVVGTLFGVATSLGLGVMQINAGLEHLNLLSMGTINQVLLIAGITAVATVSVVSGVDVGIRRLSEMNIVVATLLVIFVFVVGPTIFLLGSFAQSLGYYASTLVEMTFRTDAFIGPSWQKNWTMFYWGWWISWSPFVGMFIARISRGRTIREFILGVMLVPTLVTFFWISVFGGTAIHIEMFGSGGIAEAVQNSVPTALYVTLERLPWSTLTTGLATLVVATFFVTSSDSASLVIDMITAGGHPEPPVGQKIFWAVTEGTVAAVLLWTGGEASLLALQTAAVTTGLPVCVILLLVCFSLLKGLRAEVATADSLTRLSKEGSPRLSTARGSRPPVAANASIHKSARQEDNGKPPRPDWRSRLAALIGSSDGTSDKRTPELARAHAQIAQFLQEIVLPAFKALQVELEQHGRSATIEKQACHARLTVLREGVEEFSYAIMGHAYRRQSVAYPEIQEDTGDRDCVAEVVLRSGHRKQRPLSEMTEERIIEDFLEEYAFWIGW